MKLMTSICIGLNVACLLLIFIFQAISYSGFSQAFYKYEFKKNGTAALLKTSEGDLLGVSNTISSYLKLDIDSIQHSIKIDDVDRDFFNEREIHHMEDVRRLFEVGFSLNYACLGVFIVTVFILKNLLSPFWETLCTIYRKFFSWFLVAFFTVSTFIGINFERMFVVFHELIFTNDYWLLDPETSLLINIVPFGFFIDISIFIVSVFLLEIAALFVLINVMQKRMR